MLHINRMRIQLPSGYEHRSSTITRLIGKSLENFQPTENRTFDHLSIGPLQVALDATDQEIASSVIERITSLIRKER